MGVNSLPKTVTWQRRNCDLNPGPFVPESSMLTIRLLSHPICWYHCYFRTTHVTEYRICERNQWITAIADSLVICKIPFAIELQTSSVFKTYFFPYNLSFVTFDFLIMHQTSLAEHWVHANFFACCFLCTVKCEPKAMLVGCNAGITAVDIDLDVSAALHCTDMADAELYAVK